MKANELMIGDYLRVNRDGLCIKKDTIVEVREIDANNKFENHIGCAGCRPLDDLQYEGGIWCDYLDPIPLTPEILEKIGFIPFDDKSPWINCKWHWEGVGVRNIPTVTITSYEGLDSGVRFLTEIEADCSHKVGINRIHSCDIEYAHELQHALRLCGLEKKIEL